MLGQRQLLDELKITHKLNIQWQYQTRQRASIQCYEAALGTSGKARLNKDLLPPYSNSHGFACRYFRWDSAKRAAYIASCHSGAAGWCSRLQAHLQMYGSLSSTDLPASRLPTVFKPQLLSPRLVGLHKAVCITYTLATQPFRPPEAPGAWPHHDIPTVLSTHAPSASFGSLK